MSALDVFLWAGVMVSGYVIDKHSVGLASIILYGCAYALGTRTCKH